MTGTRRILHIGLRKTATTWLQRGAKRAFDAGVIEYDHRKVKQWARALPIEGPTDKDFAELANCLPRRTDVPCFVSMEGLIRFDNAKIGEAVVKVWPDAHILVTTRNPQAYLMSSLFNNSQTKGSDIKSFTTRYVKNHMMKIFAFDHIHATYANVFGLDRIHFVPYEILVDDPSRYVDHISGILDFPIGQFLPAEKRNASPPPAFVLMMRRINELLKEEAPFLLTSRDWQTFLTIATRAVTTVKESDEEFSELFQNDEALSDALPRIDGEARQRLARGMSLLRSLPSYVPYLTSYGLAAPRQEPDR